VSSTASAYVKPPVNWYPFPSDSREPPSRSNSPPPRRMLKPSFCRGVLVMMFTTPFTALAPQTTDAGPRTTSICSMSPEVGDGTKSHSTSPKKSR
jgi:hypothetical protein